MQTRIHVGEEPSVVVNAPDVKARADIEDVARMHARDGMLDEGVAGETLQDLPDALRAIRNGDMLATVEQSPGKQVRTAMEELVGYLRDKTPMQSVSLPPFVVDSTNLDKAERIDEAR